MQIFFHRLIFCCLFIFCVAFTINGYAVDKILCHITYNGIPAQTTNGVSYINTYVCQNVYPSSFPSILLVGQVVGQNQGTSVAGSCTTQNIGPGQSCEFILQYNPTASATQTFNLQISIGTLYFLNLPSITTTSSAPF